MLKIRISGPLTQTALELKRDLQILYPDISVKLTKKVSKIVKNKKMKTKEEIIADYKSKCLDSRDLHRLVEYLTVEDCTAMGLELEEEYVKTHKAKELTKENILKDLERDLAFAFKKALGQRGLSASFMFEVVQMWNWMLQEGLEDWSDDNYAHYGLPLFKATALKYGLDNPIGDDEGDEQKYAS